MTEKDFIGLPLTNSLFVPHWVHTKLTVAVILSLLLLLPALAHAKGIMCEVGLWGEEDKQRTGWRDEKKREWLSAVAPCRSQTLFPVSLEKGQGCHYKTQASHSSALEEALYVMGSHPCYIFHLNYNVKTVSFTLHQFHCNLSLLKDCTQRETLTARFEGGGCN